YEPHLLPKDSGWMRFSKAIYTDSDGEPYDKVLWSRENDRLTVVWINCGGVLLNYTAVQEDYKVADVSLQTLFVALHVLGQPLIANEDFQVRKPTHGRRKLKVKAATIRKVILRRVIHPNHEGTVGSIEYHCRWVVQSYWRMQRYTSTGHIRPLLIAAYVKGPAN